MMKRPCARAFFTTSFNGPAISATRRAADLHQWSSHMSHTTSAVFFGSHVALFSTTVKVFDSFGEGTRERILRCSIESAACVSMGNNEQETRNAGTETSASGWKFMRDC